MEDILHAAGADEVITIQRYAHLVGGARMARDERNGVVDRSCRTFAVPNLYITDGSVLPTQGSANPALTIMAVAARAADHLAAGAAFRDRVMNDPVIGSVGAAAYTVPTDAPEADGTLSWDATTLVLARVRAGGEAGLGWTYGAAASAALIGGTLAERGARPRRHATWAAAATRWSGPCATSAGPGWPATRSRRSTSPCGT